MRMRFVVIGCTLSMMLSLAGCSALSSSASETFTKKGLPHQKYLIGGGFEVYYMPHIPGTAYWVDETTKRILVTETVEAEEHIEFEHDAEVFEESYGIPVKEAKLSLYFIPNTELP